MTLRDEAEQLYKNAFYDGKDGREFMTTRVLAFLNTPELKEMQEIKEQFESLIEEHQRYIRQAEEWREKAKKFDSYASLGDTFPEVIIQEWREDAAKWKEFVADNRDLLTNINEILALRKENAELKEKADICDALSKDYDFDLREIQKWKENSDKWDAYSPLRVQEQQRWDELQEKVKHLDLIMEGLEVKEKFNEYEGFHNCEGFARTRPATPEEVREVLEIVLSSDGFSGYFRLVQNQEWRLKSGAVLKLKERRNHD